MRYQFLKGLWKWIELPLAQSIVRLSPSSSEILGFHPKIFLAFELSQTSFPTSKGLRRVVSFLIVTFLSIRDAIFVANSLTEIELPLPKLITSPSTPGQMAERMIPLAVSST